MARTVSRGGAARTAARTVARGGAARTAARTVARGEEGEGEDGAPAIHRR
jgi:hypothetical protein